MIRGVTRERLKAPQARIATALLYHSVRDSSGRKDPTADDACTISAQQFADQLDIVGEAGHPVSTVSDLAEVRGMRRGAVMHERVLVLTFDDGTASHLDTVLHMLWERNLPGEFFVNPANVGRRGFLSWNELRGMSSAGMSIQSHGYSHRYMDELDDAGVVDELLRSRKTIEDRLGQAVTVFAAPGGRVNHFIAALARRVGYKAVCGSRPGQWRPNANVSVIPRNAVRAGTTERELRDWIDSRAFALAVQAGRYEVLKLARRLLGDRTYDNLRRRRLHDDARH
ncbi:MAG TPA: polysaccharide deacetylase family protein [Gammaproteobacteria bacterium]